MSKLLETGKLLTLYLEQKNQVIEMTEDLLKLNTSLREAGMAQLNHDELRLTNQFLIMLQDNSNKKNL